MGKNELFTKFKKMVYDLSTQEEDYFFFVNQHEQEMLKNDPILFIGLRTDYYLQRDKIDQGLAVVEHYKQANYISMEVEDFLNELKQEIINNKNAQTKVLNDNQLAEFLFSKNEYKVIDAIRLYSNKNIRNYINIFKKFLKENKSEKMQRLVLILFVEQHVNNLFTFYLNGEEKSINPSTLKLPFESEMYKKMIDYITSKNKNPSDINRLKEIYSCILVKSYPDDLFLNLSKEQIYLYLISLDQELMGLKVDKEKIKGDATYLKLKECFFN